MKKILCAFCTVVIFTLGFSYSIYASDFLRVFETFDDGVLNTLVLPGGASIVETHDGKTVMELNGDISNTWAQIEFDALSGLFLASSEFMQPAYGTADVCRIHNSSGGSEIARVYTESSYIKMQSGNSAVTLAPYNTNQWYKIDIIGNVATKTGTVYIDGIARGNFSFIKTAAFDVGNFLCFNRSNMITYIDNIYVAPFSDSSTAVYFSQTFGDTLQNSSMYSSDGFSNVISAFEKIAVSGNEEELNEAKAYLEECRYKLLTSDGNGNYSIEKNVQSDVFVAETDFKLSEGGGADVLVLYAEDTSVLEFTASESDGLWLRGEDGDVCIADSLDTGVWYTMKVICDAEANDICVILNGMVIFDGKSSVTDEFITCVGVSGNENYDGECIIGGAIVVSESDSFDLSKAIFAAKAQLDFYPELYSDEEKVILSEAILTVKDTKASLKDREEALNVIKNTAFELLHKMTDSDCFVLGKTYDIENLSGFGVIEGAFTLVSDTSGKTIVFELSDSKSGMEFCSVYVKNGALYAQSGDDEILLADNLGLFSSHNIMAVADTLKRKIKLFLDDEYLTSSDEIECNTDLNTVDTVAVKLSASGACVARRDDYTLNKVDGANIENIESIDDLNFAIRISDFVKAMNNSSRSTIYDLVVSNEEMLCDYGLKDDFVSLGENQKNKVCLKLLNKSFKTLEDIADELNKETKKLLDDAKKTSSSKGGSSSGTSRVNVSKPVEITVPETALPQNPPDVETTVYVFPFEDIAKSHWAYSSVKSLNEKGVIDGVTQNTFEPDSNISREAFIKLIVTAFGIEPMNGNCIFSDVSADLWYTPYINAAYNAGIVTGDENGNFGVDKNITREDMFTVIYRVLQSKGVELSGDDISDVYTDFDFVSDYAKDAVSALISEKIVSGMTDTAIVPEATATRAMAAKLIHTITEKGWSL